MKKVYRRFSALLMCIILTLSLASVASAATVTWSDSEGGKTLTLTISEWGYRQVAVTNPKKTYHPQGTVTNLPPYGSFTATINATYTSTNYRSKLIQAMNIDGIMPTYTISGTHTSPLSVPAGDPSGNYTLGVLFDTKSGSWGVTTGNVLTPNSRAGGLLPVETGTLYYAPRGTVYGYVAMPVP